MTGVPRIALMFIVLLLLTVAAPATAYAGQPPSANVTPGPPPTQVGKAPPAATPSPGGSSIYVRPPWLSSHEFGLSVMVLLLGSASLGLPIFALRKHAITPDEIIRLVSVVLIIAGTLLLITGGFSAQQIAPAMGLFGTIAGYVLGKAGSKPTGEDPPRGQPK